MTFGQRLRSLRLAKDLTQAELAKLMGLGESTVSFYEADKRKPDFDTLIKIAEYFDVSTDFILGFKSSMPSFTIIKLPILGTIRAGLPILEEENIEGYLEVPDYMRADYVLQVKGDSMIGAGILNGDLAVCREETVPQTEQIIVALRDEGSLSEATLKFYMNSNGSPVLRAANPSFADIDYNDGFRTAGVMVALVRKDAPGYQTYRSYIAVPGYDDWTDVVETAITIGIKPDRIKSFIQMLNEMSKTY